MSFCRKMLRKKSRRKTIKSDFECIIPPTFLKMAGKKMLEKYDGTWCSQNIPKSISE